MNANVPRSVTTLQQYDSIAYLKLGNCSKALNFSYEYSPHAVHRESYLLDIARDEITLKVVNIGAGTTGTRDLARLICKEFGLKTLHYTAVCNTPYHGVAEQFSPLRLYFDIKASDFLRFYYKEVLLEVLTQYELLTDDPLAQLLPDILLAVPDVSILATLRDPLSWARRRKEKHPRAVICQPLLWDHPNVLHPFDFIGCLQQAGDQTVGEAIVLVQNISETSLASAFVLYNTVSLHQVLAAGCPVQAFCFWDMPAEQHSTTRMTSKLRHFWRKSPSTARFLKKRKKIAKNLPSALLRTNRNLTKYKFDVLNNHTPTQGNWSGIVTYPMPSCFPTGSVALSIDLHTHYYFLAAFVLWSIVLVFTSLVIRFVVKQRR